MADKKQSGGSKGGSKGGKTPSEAAKRIWGEQVPAGGIKIIPPKPKKG